LTRTILIPLDTSTNARLPVDYAITILHATDGRLILYSAIPDEALRHHMEHQLARVAERAQQAGINVTSRIECRTGVASAIVDKVRADEADLIAMATSAWSDVDRWLRGSVADEVVRQTEVPVLIVPARAGQTVLEATQRIGAQRQQALTLGSAWPSPGEQQPRIVVALDGCDPALRPSSRRVRSPWN
jgi:nucleotide-binding universal stress UspA family protein